MRNLTAPKQYTDDKDRTTFDAGSEGLVLYTPAGDPVRLHVGSDGFLYVNDQPFGVQGMPPALHAAMHATGGGDPVTPAAIGAVPVSRLTESPTPSGVPVLDSKGHLPVAMISGKVEPTSHAASHAKGGVDAITPTSIGAVAFDDSRLTNARKPTGHAASHAVGGSDAIAPGDIGAVAENDTRLNDSRTPRHHRSTHHKNGPDPLSWEDVGSVDAGMFTTRERIPGGYPQLNDNGHIDVNLLPSSTLLPGHHASSHAVDGTDTITPISIDAADRKHTHDNSDIISVDASKISSGVLDIARIPQGALERLKIVPNLAAMLALTSLEVQVGDTVQRADTKVMYRVVDESALGTMAAFVEYSAGRAAAVLWSGVEGKPNAFTPSSHAASHATGGADAITPASINAASVSQLNTHASTAASPSVTGHVALDALAADGSATAAPGGFGLGVFAPISTDLDTIVGTQFFRGGGTTANRPINLSVYGIHIQYSTASAIQEAWTHETPPRKYTRRFHMGAWEDWSPSPNSITDNTNTTSSTIAASATAVKALATRIAALETAVKSLATRIAALETAMASAVFSNNIASISGTKLPEDGVGYIEYAPRESE